MILRGAWKSSHLQELREDWALASALGWLGSFEQLWLVDGCLSLESIGQSLLTLSLLSICLQKYWKLVFILLKVSGVIDPLDPTAPFAKKFKKIMQSFGRIWTSNLCRNTRPVQCPIIKAMHFPTGITPLEPLSSIRGKKCPLWQKYVTNMKIATLVRNPNILKH